MALSLFPSTFYLGRRVNAWNSRHGKVNIKMISLTLRRKFWPIASQMFKFRWKVPWLFRHCSWTLRAVPIHFKISQSLQHATQCSGPHFWNTKPLVSFQDMGIGQKNVTHSLPQKYLIDSCDRASNTVYKCWGTCDMVALNAASIGIPSFLEHKKPFKGDYENTQCKLTAIRKQGYILKSIWECDFRQMMKDDL